MIDEPASGYYWVVIRADDEHLGEGNHEILVIGLYESRADRLRKMPVGYDGLLAARWEICGSECAIHPRRVVSGPLDPPPVSLGICEEEP